jgi:hypothetical protein
VQPAIGVAPGRLGTFRTLTFAVLVVLIAVLFGMFARAAVRAGRHDGGFGGALALLLPSVPPIAFGYLLAHYLQYLLVDSQMLFPLIGDPPCKDWWPLHLPFPFNDSYEVHPHFLPTAFYWYLAVVVIVAVHVVAVVIAHRHLGRTAPDPASARRSEYPDRSRWSPTPCSACGFSPSR